MATNPERKPDLPEPPGWHALPVDDALQRVGADDSGLSEEDARRRLEQFGPNQIAAEEQSHPLWVLLKQFRSPLIYILLVAALVTTILQEFIDSAVIAAVLVLNAIIGFTQERQAERSIQALQQLVAPRARVIRNGRDQDVESTQLAAGDLVLFESGTRVPADVRVLTASALLADESLMTGESIPVQKTNQPVAEDTPVADRSNMLFAGTTITSGRGRGVVVETGSRTALGAIAEQVRGREEVQTPLQDRMNRFARIVGVAVLSSTVLAFVLGIALGNSVADMFMVGVALAVAAVPEGLPVVFTITLAIGVHRMAQRNAIIRRLPAVETLGSATVIGTDKTGTLTENRMTVLRAWTPTGLFESNQRGHPSGPGETRGEYRDDVSRHPALRQALQAAVLTNEASVEVRDDGYDVRGDPTEAALLIDSIQRGISPQDLRTAHTVVSETPFEPDLQYSASLRATDASYALYVKGAPERVLEMCSSMAAADGTAELDRSMVVDAAASMAEDGLRVLATAWRPVARVPDETEVLPEPQDLILAGLFGMLDPPREGVHEAIDGCQRAGLRVVMITGDHSATATAIGRQLGIVHGDAEVLTGRDLDRMDDRTLGEAVERVAIFARVSPEHKLRVVDALQGRAHVVGVTGDGVNDAPALRAADIGIAMGKGGTDVAREASDMVLTDDNFVSIYNAVEQGRITFDNVRKVTFFLVSTGAAAILTMLTALVLGWPFPFVPAQLLWLNLVTSGLQDVALAFEPGDRDVLERRPRPRDEGIVSSLLWERTVIAGIVIAAGTLLLFWMELQRDSTLAQAQTVALTTMVIFQMFHVGNARSDYRSTFRVSLFSNPFLLIATGAAFLVHTAALYLSPTQFVLRVEPISIDSWIRIIAVALTIILAVELHKLFRRRYPASDAGQ